MSGFVPLNAGYTVAVRRTRLKVLILLTLAVGGESPTGILHEDPVTRKIEVPPTYAACKAEFDQKTLLADLTAVVGFFFFIFQVNVVHPAPDLVGIYPHQRGTRPSWSNKTEQKYVNACREPAW